MTSILAYYIYILHYNYISIFRTYVMISVSYTPYTNGEKLRTIKDEWALPQLELDSTYDYSLLASESSESAVKCIPGEDPTFDQPCWQSLVRLPSAVTQVLRDKVTQFHF